MEPEKLIKIIKSSGCTIINEDSFMELIDGTTNLERNLIFTALGDKYVIEWWKNVMYLKFNKAKIVFRSVSADGCWPNGYKMSINLIANGENVAIIPTQEY